MATTAALWALSPRLGMPPALSIALGLAVAMGCAISFSRRAAASLRAAIAGLAAFVGELASGHPHEVLLAQPEELSVLAERLGQLSEHFQRTLADSIRRQRELSAILAGLADGCIAVDGHGRIILFNQAAARLFGVGEKEALNRPLVEVIRSYDLVTAVQAALASGEKQIREFRVSSPEERTLQVTTTVLAADGPRGQSDRSPGREAAPAGAVALVRDVTELRRLERVRTDFVANVSHELRTPLTAIKGFIETLQEGGVEDEATRRRFLEIMARETDRLVSLINDLLDLSRLESRTADFHPRPVPVNQVAEAAIVMFRKKAEAKGLKLVAQFPADLPPVLADEDMLRQVFINLLDNAVKYTQSGEIRVAAQRAQLPSGRPAVAVSVADTGIGIPRQHLGRIFERFYRVDRARSRELGGTGLGLSIVRHIAEIHGGQIEVESEVGVGSTFRLTLPAADELAETGASRLRPVAQGPGA